jgi:hypothetical protein
MLKPSQKALTPSRLLFLLLSVGDDNMLALPSNVRDKVRARLP